MTTETRPTSCKSVRRLIGAHVEIEFPYLSHWRDPERYAKALEAECREFAEFIRDHRSRDYVTLNTVRDHEDQCSACGARWETMPADVDGPEACASCGVVVDNETDTAKSGGGAC